MKSEQFDSHLHMENAYREYMRQTQEQDIPPEKSEVATLLRRIADRVISSARFTLYDIDQEETIDDQPNDVSNTIKIESGFNDWKYWNGVLHLALLRLDGLLGSDGYTTYVLKNYDFIFKHLDLFESQYKNGQKNGSLHQFFRMDRLDDCGAMDAGLIEANAIVGKKLYTERINATASYMMTKQTRLDDGTFCRIYRDKTTVWADDAYMSVPFLIRMWRYKKEDSYLEDAVNMLLNVHRHLFDVQKGLYFHCYYPDWETHGVAYWGRANGWVIMAMVDLLLVLPDAHPSKKQLMENLRHHLVGLTRYQHKDGLWHQLVDKNDSFLESSGSAMFIYGFATAINQGWLDEIYGPVAIKAWKALTNKIRPDGLVEDISLGFNIRADLPFYYQVPPVLDDPHGIGAILFAGMAIYELKTFNPWIWE